MNKVPKDVFDGLRHIKQHQVFDRQLNCRAWTEKSYQHDSLLISIQNQSESQQGQHYQDICA